MLSLRISATFLLAAFTVWAQDIRLPPTIVKSPIERKTFRTESGDALILECVADGYPKPEYSWMKNGKPLQGFGGHIMHLQDGTISIPQLGSLDEGYYQCFASNQHGTALSNTVVLERAVLAGYTGKAIQESGYLTEGQAYMLPCNPTKWFPKPIFAWVVVDGVDDDSEKPVILDKRVQMDDDGNLHFSYIVPADAQDGKLYKCKLFNPFLDVTFGGSYARIQVTPAALALFKPVNRFVTKSPVIGLERRELTLRCFFSGHPDPAISWGKVGGSLPIGRYSISKFNTQIEIRDLQQSDAGTYSCQGQNTQGLVEQRIEVDIQAEPKFLSEDDHPRDLNFTEGQTVELPCRAAAEPTANVVWMRNGIPLVPTALPARFRLTEDGRKLIIRDVCKDCPDDTSDLMVIQCNASNVHGYAFADAYVNVLKKTAMIIRPNNLTLAVDEDIALFDFSATSDDSTPVTLQWSRVAADQSEERLYPIQGRVAVDGGTLKFVLPHNSTERAAYRGRYRARAMNGYSEDVSDVWLHAEDMPFVDPVVGGASLADFWWIILIVALLLLLLILLLCCCICCQRNKGDSYPVDEKERKNGNDPAKELADSGFKDYHRPDGEPLKGSRASLNSSIKMDSDEEASLNEYGDIDAGKFTEDGSFIGDYTTDKRRGRETFA